jgi:hypothetical protein
MRRAVLAALTFLAVATPGAAAAVKVPMMVVGRTQTLLAARNVTLKPASVTIGHRHCAVPAGTALAGLLAARLPVHVTDVAGCDPASMFVKRIGRDANRGQAGWEYKVGHTDPSAGAADPAGRLRAGQQVLWYWCVRAGACQRTLDLAIRFKNKSARIRVRGYDDTGHGGPVAGATVHFGSTTLTTDSRGIATIPLTAGRYVVYATKPGLVQSFPTTVGITP